MNACCKFVDLRNWVDRPDNRPEFILGDDNRDNRSIISNEKKALDVTECQKIHPKHNK